MTSHLKQAAIVILIVTSILFLSRTTRFGNEPLRTSLPNAERRSFNISNTQRPLIVLAISGGGARAAALGWSVLRELRDQAISETDGRSLIDDVGAISSVSGGSVIAAHFALTGRDGLETFRKDFLEHDNMRAIATNLINPVAVIERAWQGKSRTDAVQAMFDQQLFHGATFASVNQPGKPFLILNASDMSNGEVVDFTPNRFNDICANLDSVALSLGVVASSAVPIVLAPVALQNFAGQDCPVPPSNWADVKLKGKYGPHLNFESFNQARYTAELRHSNDVPAPNDELRRIPHLYLSDGGLSDNLGVHGLKSLVWGQTFKLRTDSSDNGPDSLVAAINEHVLRKVVVIVINARTQPSNTIAASHSPPGLVGMINAAVSYPIDAATTSLGSQITTDIASLNSDFSSAFLRLEEIKFYAVRIDFALLPSDTPKARALRVKVNNVPTSWNITADDLTAIQEAGVTLLRGQPCYQRLLLDMNASATYLDPEFARVGCHF